MRKQLTLLSTPSPLAPYQKLNLYSHARACFSNYGLKSVSTNEIHVYTNKAQTIDITFNPISPFRKLHVSNPQILTPFQKIVQKK